VDPIGTGLITFVCAFGAALAGTFVRGLLPPGHLSKESQDVVRLGIGLVATMTALLLGLVTASARATFDATDASVRNASADILALDRLLARYGPETKAIRETLRAAVAMRIESIWPSAGGHSNIDDNGEVASPAEDIENRILALGPQTDAQKWLQGRALNMAESVLRTRWLVLGRREGSVPRPFLTVVIFWLSVTFASFGLYAPRNLTVLIVLGVSAFSVAAAVFLILELDGPFDGIVRISSGPLRFALARLGM
jgi:hypothetical protein